MGYLATSFLKAHSLCSITYEDSYVHHLPALAEDHYSTTLGVRDFNGEIAGSELCSRN